MAYTDPEGAGVGGWLAFFVLVIAIFSPLGVVITTAAALYRDNGIAQAFPDSWVAIQAFEWALAAISIAGCWYIAWRLNKVQVWRTVQITIAGLWLLSVGTLAMEFIGISLLTGVAVANIAAAAMGPQLIRPFVFAAIWSAYFLRSKRVANTYPRHGTEIAEVFG